MRNDLIVSVLAANHVIYSQLLLIETKEGAKLIFFKTWVGVTRRGLRANNIFPLHQVLFCQLPGATNAPAWQFLREEK